MNRQVIAVEGPSGAGKTTLTSALSGVLASVSAAFSPEYVELAGGVSHVPPPPATSTQERLGVIEFFLAIERQRHIQHLQAPGNNGPLILDRSVYTLMAHSYAEEKMFGYPCFEESWNLIKNRKEVCWPGLVLYLCVPADELKRRHGHNGESFFTDVLFNTHFADFFSSSITSLNQVDAPAVIFLQGTLPPQQICQAALREIVRFISK